MNIILASNSPRRKEILNKLGYDFKIIASNYSENINHLKFTKELVENCALNKAQDVQKRTTKDNLIISADTVVVCDNIILGKPQDEKEAIKTLTMLSGKTHFVATSLCILYKNTIIKNTDITYVTFKTLSKDEIIHYIKHHKPFDKAGSYGIQDENFNFVKEIQGEKDTIIGFPSKLFISMFNSIIK